LFIAGVIVAGAGILFLFLSIIFLIIGGMCRKCTACTKGRIVDMCYNAYDFNNGGSGRASVGIYSGGSSAGTRCPIFSYQVNGVRYLRASNVAYKINQIEKNINQAKVIDVYYNPSRPQQATLAKQGALSIIGKVFLGVGAGMLVLGIIFLVIVFM